MSSLTHAEKTNQKFTDKQFPGKAATFIVWSGWVEKATPILWSGPIDRLIVIGPRVHVIFQAYVCVFNGIVDVSHCHCVGA